tara:strand:+ start:287 stop:931 length:645 start_codon:yes stop_codon:yes gene_type:complete
MDLLPKLEADFLPDTPDDIDLDTESEEDNVPLPVPEPVKPIIPEEDIFVDTKKEVKFKEEELVETDLEVKEIKADKPVKVKKPRKPLSAERLESLRIGREKALATRRANALEKKEIKELTQKKKKKDIQKLRDEVSDTHEPAPAPAKQLHYTNNMDIEKITADAIEKYEIKRKANKLIKKAKQKEEQENNDLKNMVFNSIPHAPKYGEAGFFRF